MHASYPCVLVAIIQWYPLRHCFVQHLDLWVVRIFADWVMRNMYTHTRTCVVVREPNALQIGFITPSLVSLSGWQALLIWNVQFTELQRKRVDFHRIVVVSIFDIKLSIHGAFTTVWATAALLCKDLAICPHCALYLGIHTHCVCVCWIYCLHPKHTHQFIVSIASALLFL